MRSILAMIALLIFTGLPVYAQPPKTNLPPFLPDYFAPAFEIDGKQFILQNNSEKDGIEHFLYSHSSQNEKGYISLERIKCERPRCLAIFNNILGYLNDKVPVTDGKFFELTNSELSAKIFEQGTVKAIFAYVVPDATLIFSYTSSLNDFQIVNISKKIELSVNRLRYEKSSSDNVAMGLWGEQIYKYALHLIQNGNKQEALSVLRRILNTSPYNNKAHIDLISLTNDSNEGRNSATVVYNNSEDPKLIAKAAAFLNVKISAPEDIPILSYNESGLQLIIIPLPPYNIQFLNEAAQLYEKMTKIPVKIRRLKNDWALSNPDRIYRQRDVQGFLSQQTQGKINFSGWDKKMYINALQEAAKLQNLTTAYHIDRLIESINTESGQYNVNAYHDWFCIELLKHRPNDSRTMFVGVTEANIFSGDTNYIFSLHGGIVGVQASILSYNMMLSKTLFEPYESRQRLTERIAKELVPASLKSLGIPRSTDPKCPYSYSSGVERLDQKGLILSEQVTNAINNLK